MGGFEIIGHPITKEDVEEVLKKLLSGSELEDAIYGLTFAFDGWKCGLYYQEQSEETKNYIANLILG